MTSFPQNSSSNPQLPFISPQNQIMPQMNPEQGIPISQQIYPPTQPQPLENIDPSKYI